MATKPSLALKRRFKAPPAQLYQAWTQPEKMIRWWGVTGHDKTPIAETDLRVGGRFRVQFWTPDGDYMDEEGHLYQGRKAIEESFQKLFAAAGTPELAHCLSREREPA